jgi:ribonuclease HI
LKEKLFTIITTKNLNGLFLVDGFEVLHYVDRLHFNCTNNIAEYEAVLLGLRKLRAMGIRIAVLKSNSQVITCQVDKAARQGI